MRRLSESTAHLKYERLRQLQPRLASIADRTLTRESDAELYDAVEQQVHMTAQKLMMICDTALASDDVPSAAAAGRHDRAQGVEASQKGARTARTT